MPRNTSKGPLPVLKSFGEKAQELLSSARRKISSIEHEHLPQTRLPGAERRQEMIVHISLRSVIKATFGILVMGLAVALIGNLSDKILLLVLGMLIATIIDPGVSRLQRFGVPRIIGILLHYFIAIFLISYLISNLIPTIARELVQAARDISFLANNAISDPNFSIPYLPQRFNDDVVALIQRGLSNLSVDQLASAIDRIGRNLLTAAQGSFSFAAQVAGSVLTFITKLIIVLVLACFMQMEKERILAWLKSFVPGKYRQYVEIKSQQIHTKIGQWAGGQLLLSLSIFILTFFALLILRMPYALTFAVLAGFCELIPYVGPFIAAIAPILVALAKGKFLLALVLVGVYYAIQWSENNLLVPLIMRRVVGLSPVAIIFGIMVGVSFPEVIPPVLGIMLAVPTATIIAIFLEDWRNVEDKKK